jgi:hypothetical protein
MEWKKDPLRDTMSCVKISKFRVHELQTSALCIKQWHFEDILDFHINGRVDEQYHKMNPVMN